MVTWWLQDETRWQLHGWRLLTVGSCELGISCGTCEALRMELQTRNWISMSWEQQRGCGDGNTPLWPHPSPFRPHPPTVCEFMKIWLPCVTSVFPTSSNLWNSFIPQTFTDQYWYEWLGVLIALGCNHILFILREIVGPNGWECAFWSPVSWLHGFQSLH